MFDDHNENLYSDALELPTLFKQASSQLFPELVFDQACPDLLILPEEPGVEAVGKLAQVEQQILSALEPTDEKVPASNTSAELDTPDLQTPTFQGGEETPEETPSESGEAKSEQDILPADPPSPKPVAKKPEGKRSWDNFRIKRDCFRLFSTYYKNNFKKWNKVWQSEKRNKRKRSDMKELIYRYC